MTDHEEKLTDGKNGVTIKCKHCPSVILTPASATLTSAQEFNLPLEVQPKQTATTDTSNTVQTEPIGPSWAVDDVYIFHNVGFSTTVNNSTKYLICADCELGPIGFHDLPSKKSYVALSRVCHVQNKNSIVDADAITSTTAE